MDLRTLGELRLEASDFKRAKTLLLVSYLALEGARDRRHVAELFWPGATDARKSLTVSLAQARKAAPGILEANATSVWTNLTVDAPKFLACVETGEHERALALYEGPFLDGLTLRSGEHELEEWVYDTREFLAAAAQKAHLELAKEQAGRSAFESASRHAAQAYGLRGAAPAEAETLQLLHSLMLAANSPRAGELAKEASDYGISLLGSSEAARAQLMAAFAPEHSVTAPALPVRNTSFVGRDVELAEVAGLLMKTDTVLVTLVGPGGVGKTRLALQIAQEQRRLKAFSDGVFFVSLETLSAPEQLPQALAEALGLTLKPGLVPLEQVTRALEDKRLLLVLDNFEQVLRSALILPELLRRCPALKLLVTSRERLGLEEEQVFPLDGLAFGATSLAPNELGRLDAVRLFVNRAKRSRPDFALTEGTLPGVLAICERVEGLPLGLELAAVWIKLMPVGDIADALGERLDLLSTDLKNVPDRHRSVRSAFETSWQRLTAGEQNLLAQLAVFRGGFGRDAAREVAGATIPRLASLVDTSLIRASAEGRYECHTLIYEFSREKLAQSPELEAEAVSRHARYYLAFLAQQETSVKGADQLGALARLDKEAANLRAAWDHACREAWADELLQASLTLKHFLATYLRADEGLAAFGRAAASLDEANPKHRKALGNLLIHQADMAERLGRDQDAEVAALCGLTLLRRVPDPKGVSAGLNLLGALATNRAAYDEARTYFEENLGFAQAHGDLWVKRIALGNLAIVEHHCGNVEAASAYYAETLELFRQAGEVVNVIRTLTNVGQLHLSAMDFAEAKRYFDEALALKSEHAFGAVSSLLCVGLGVVAYEGGRHTEAITQLTRALDQAQAAGDRHRTADTLAKLGKVECLAFGGEAGQGHLTEALRLALEGSAASVLLSVLSEWAEALKLALPARAAEIACLVRAHPKTKFGTRLRVQALLEVLELAPETMEEACFTGRQMRPEDAARALLSGAEVQGAAAPGLKTEAG